jgi:isoleucyl-tRNA synthetase
MSAKFTKVPQVLDFPAEEQEVLSFWKSAGIFERSVKERQGKPTFVFYEGPPTANGLPHNGHVLTRVVKDLFPRYKTMRGFQVERKAGWDTHGLPVEVEVEKELRIHGKAAIEQYGIEPFAKKCIESVFRYTDEWERLTERIGFWVDLPTAYVTYHKDYVESVWWALSELFEKGLLYKAHKVVWWWAQGGTALSSAEVGLGYKTVDDPSVYVAFPLRDGSGRSLLVWTTTPWTLPSNMYAAINPKFEYVEVEAKGKRLIVAKGLVDALAKKLGGAEIKATLPGTQLVGTAYDPPFDLFAKDRATVSGDNEHFWTVIAADFVTLDAGSGIVHVAPAFGEDDYNAHKAQYKGGMWPAPYSAVLPDGSFIPELSAYAGRWVKDCDKDISHELKERGLMVHAEQYRHEYPFCWRSDQDPLIQFARPAWYIRTTQQKDGALHNNESVNWLPPHIKEGRMGDFLANNVDWALSRERYWGTPLNVWVCDKDSAHMVAPSSVADIESKGGSFAYFDEAKKKDPSLSEHLRVHKPWIDHVTIPCAQCGGVMKRVTEVIDCWFDSGCMPFAQWGYPHKGVAEFNRSFPADFISEAIDQTRGWFYSLLMISTLVFDDKGQQKLKAKGLLDTVQAHPHPYKTCIVLGHVSDKEGKKESKSKGNYTPPEIILDQVAMDFAVLGESKGVVAEAGVAFVAREDLEGMDVAENAKVNLNAPGASGDGRSVTIKVGKHMPRRVVVLHESERAALGLQNTGTLDVKPVEVPRLPKNERVTVRDPASPAPGADAFRWFFYASNPPWSNTRHSLSNVRALQKETLIKLRNVYSFFTIYANIDAYDPLVARLPRAERTELDRWMLGELSDTVTGVTRDMDAYDVYGATQKLATLVDAVSNWYLRRSRDRFWRSGFDVDKRAAYDTLFEVLLDTARCFAPFVPFMAEAMYRNLSLPLKGQPGVTDSVHLASFPSADASAVDAVLSRRMRAVRDLVSLGLQVRTEAKLKVRQPLSVAHVILSDRSLSEGLLASQGMMKEELNVQSVSFVPPADVETFVTYRLKPNFRSLGQRNLGKVAQDLKKVFAAYDAHAAATLVAELYASGKSMVQGTEVLLDDVEIAFEAKDGFAAAGGRVGVVILDTRIDQELKDLGFMRELQNRIQTARKEDGLEYTDRIRVWAWGSPRLAALLSVHGAAVATECLAVEMLAQEAPSSAKTRDIDVDGEALHLGIARA